MNTYAAIHMPHIHIFLKRERRIVGWWDTWEGREGCPLRNAEFRNKRKSRLLLEVGRLEVDMGHARVDCHPDWIQNREQGLWKQLRC